MTQTQAVADDRDAGEAHGRARQHRVEQAGGRQRDGDGVVAERPAEVLEDRPVGAPGQAGGGGDAGQVRRSSTMSADSMATWAPEPMAMPRSAWTRAGASLMPSPTMATTRPSSCRRLISAALARGRPRPRTRSMPTWRRWASGRPVVPREHDQPEAHRRQVGDRVRRPRFDRVGQGQGAPGLPVPGGQHHRVARRLQVARRWRRARAGRHALVLEQERPPDDDRVSVDDRPDAVAGDRLEVGRLGAVRGTPMGGAGGDGLADRVLGAGLGGPGEPEQPSSPWSRPPSPPRPGSSPRS